MAHGPEIAAFILEPVPENMGIVLPDDGYLAAAVDIVHKHGALVIFDEVKTGITSHPGGASAHFGVMPDLVCLAKSIGGGVPVGAFGGRHEIMQLIVDWDVAQQGTFNGNPLIMAAAKSVLTEICTDGGLGQGQRRERSIAGRLPVGHRRCRHPGPHRRPGRQGLHHLRPRAGSQLPRLQEDATSIWRTPTGST